MRMRFEQPPPHQGLTAQQATLWAMKEIQRRIVNRAQEIVTANTKTGAVRRSITAEDPVITGDTISGAVGAGGAGAPYAKALEYGTGIYSEAPDSTHKPIVIKPVHAKALAWPQGWLGAAGGQYRRLSGNLRTSVLKKLASGKLAPGQVFVFARKVVQQGHHPHPFLRKAFEESQAWVADVMEEALKKMWG